MISPDIKLELNRNELNVLDKLFDVLTETQLKEHGFTKSEINDVYSVIAEVRYKKDVHGLWSTTDEECEA